MLAKCQRLDGRERGHPRTRPVCPGVPVHPEVMVIGKPLPTSMVYVPFIQETLFKCSSGHRCGAHYKLDLRALSKHRGGGPSFWLLRQSRWLLVLAVVIGAPLKAAAPVCTRVALLCSLRRGGSWVSGAVIPRTLRQQGCSRAKAAF